MDEPTEEISPFNSGHTVGLFDGIETLGYPKLQASMRASPVVVLHIDPKDAIEMPETQVRAGAASTTTERVGTARRPGSG